MKLNIAHIADFQLEARKSGHGNRYDECKKILQDTITKVSLQKPTHIVITGDLYEFALTTAEERKLLTWFLRELAKITYVIITNGNHDLKQSNNELTIDHESRVQSDDIESVLDAMQNPNIRYLKRTDFYLDVFGVNFAVWGHYEKFNRVENDQRPYRVWDLPNADDYIEMAKNGQMIELFHDPIRGCRNFSGNKDDNFSNYKITLDMFKCRLVLGGDIHNPDIIRYTHDGYDRVFTYCSSTMQRNYGEGDYYNNLNLVQSGNAKHGYNKVTFENGEATIEFQPIEPSVARHTIILDDKFNYDALEQLEIKNYPMNRVRFKVMDNISGFYKNQDRLYKHILDNYNCVIDEAVFGKGVGVELEDDGIEVSDVESIIDDTKILELSDVYISNAIDKTSTIAKEDKQSAKDMLKKLFESEFRKRTDDGNNMKNVVLKSLKVSNALTFGDNVGIDFGKNGQIVRIGGSNAVGKTKIFTIVGYMFTDLIHADQKPNQHKNNRLEIFNYTRPNDVVECEMVFYVNGIKHELKKTVTRSWKRGNSKWEQKDWKSFISGTPTLDISLTYDDVIETDYDTVMEYLRDIVTFEDFNTHLFTNTESLSSLLKMNSDTLISQILKMIGLNFFDSLNQTYDDIKAAITDKLVKPSGSVDSMLEKIGVLEKEIENHQTMKKEKQDVIDGLETLQTNDSKEVENLARMIGSTKTVQEVQTSIDTLNVEESDINSNIGLKEGVIKTTTDAINSVDLEALNARANEITTQKEACILEIANKESELSNIESKVGIIKSELTNYANQKENDKIPLIEVEKGKKTELDNEIARYQKRGTEIKGIVNDKLNAKKEAHASELKTLGDNINGLLREKNEVSIEKTGLENLISTYNTNINNLESEISVLESGTKCPTCGSMKDPKTLKGIYETVEHKKSDIKALRLTISETEETLKPITERFQIVSQNIESLRGELNELESKEIKHTLEDEPTLMTELRGYGDRIIAINNEKLAIDKVIEGIKEDKSYLKDDYVTDRAKFANGVLETKKAISQDITDINTKFEKLKTEFDDIVAEKETRSNNVNKLVVLESEKSSLEKDLEIIKGRRILLDEEMAKANSGKALYEQLEAIKDRLNQRKTLISQHKDELTTKDGEKDVKLRDIERLRTDIENLKRYTLVTAVLKQYKTMLGKTGLQKYIFSKIVDILNAKLSYLLEDLDFRLFFDKDELSLKMYNLRKNAVSGVQMTSGMEVSILGLSLLNALKMLNRVRSFNFIMIDEISGKLNNGKNLTYEAPNYQALFISLLHKIKEMTCVYIVDHAIEDLGEDIRLEVAYTDGGSIIKTI